MDNEVTDAEFLSTAKAQLKDVVVIIIAALSKGVNQDEAMAKHAQDICTSILHRVVERNWRHVTKAENDYLGYCARELREASETKTAASVVAALNNLIFTMEVVYADSVWTKEDDAGFEAALDEILSGDKDAS